jgi:hypothetical protein
MDALVATFRYVLVTAIRDRMALALLVAQLAVLSAAELMGAAALAEGRETGLAIAGGGLRLVMALGLITFVCFHTRRMEETREIEVILTRPISRVTFVIAYFAAYSGLAVLLALFAVPLLGIGFRAWGPGLALWEASLLLECCVIVALSLFCALSLRSATASVLAAAGLYLLCRLGAYFRAISVQHTGDLANAAADRAAQWAVEIVAAVLPRLDLFGQSSWLVYGADGRWGMGTLLAQAAIAIVLLQAATIFDVGKRRF